MFRIHNNDIYLTRGDTAKIELMVFDRKGKPHTLKANDRIFFTMKKDTQSKNIIILKKMIGTDTNTITFDIFPEDTGDLDFGEYVYDICIISDTGETNTLYVNKFIVTDEVLFGFEVE